MPLMTRPLKITCVQSIAASAGGMPSIATLPPWFIASSIWRKAAGTPDISSPTSKPSIMPSSLHHVVQRSRFATFTARLAPIFVASARR